MVSVRGFCFYFDLGKFSALTSCGSKNFAKPIAQQFCLNMKSPVLWVRIGAWEDSLNIFEIKSKYFPKVLKFFSKVFYKPGYRFKFEDRDLKRKFEHFDLNENDGIGLKDDLSNSLPFKRCLASSPAWQILTNLIPKDTCKNLNVLVSGADRKL